MKWFTSPLCIQHRACRDCRTDAAFRQSLLDHGKVAERDFECPHGFTATNLPVRGLGDLVEKAVKPLAKLLRLGCLEPSGALKPQSPCAKRRAWLNKL